MLLTSETCLTEDICDNEIDCDGYKTFRNDSHSRYTGGCCVYVRDDVKAEIFNKSTLQEKAWILSVKMWNVGMELVLSVVYFSPNGGKKACTDFFDEWCDSYIGEADRHIVCGDFNVNLLKYGTYQRKVKQVIESNGMKQYVKEATRITETYRSLIDLVMSTPCKNKLLTDRTRWSMNTHDFLLTRRAVVTQCILLHVSHHFCS